MQLLRARGRLLATTTTRRPPHPAAPRQGTRAVVRAASMAEKRAAAAPPSPSPAPNFRDLAEACSTIQPGRIWRCARPTAATEPDVAFLLDTLGIRDLVDLRSTEELAEDPFHELARSGFSHALNLSPVGSVGEGGHKQGHTEGRKEGGGGIALRAAAAGGAHQPQPGSSSGRGGGSGGAGATGAVHNPLASHPGAGWEGSSTAPSSTGPSSAGLSSAGSSSATVHGPSPSTSANSVSSAGCGEAAATSKASGGGGEGGAAAPRSRVRTLLQGTHFRRYVRQWLSWQLAVDRRGPEDAPVTHHQVSLLERSRFYRALPRHVPAVSLAKAAALSLVSRERSRLVLLREVNAGGLVLLNKLLVDSARPEICTVLELLLQCLEGGRPALFFCKAGKDRTGVVAMLVLSCAGASEEQIIADYIRSDAYHVMALAGIENKPELKGLDRAAFERAPAGAMRALLRHLKATYGGAAAYMEHIGFGRDKQRRMAELLAREGGAR